MYMKMTDIRILSHEELVKKLSESEQELRAFAFQIAAGQLKTVRKVRNTRQLIARIKTLLREKKH